MQRTKLVFRGISYRAVRLSPLERAVLSLLIRRRRTKEIAHELQTSYATVRKTISGLIRGLEVDTRAGLIIWALQQSPEVLRDNVAGELGLHPDRCQCDSLYCAWRRAAYPDAA